MRELAPDPQPKAFEGEVARVVVERIWQRQAGHNGAPPAPHPVVVVHMLLKQECMAQQQTGPDGRIEPLTVMAFTPDRFAALVLELASVVGRVGESAREMIRMPGAPPA